MERGVRSPNWAQHLGAVSGSDCYVNSDAYGDTDEVVCVFSYGGTEPHALVTVVDYNADGMIRDGWVTSQVTKLLELCRKPAGEGDRNGFKPLDAPVARRMLEAALAETDAADQSAGQRVVRLVPRVHPGPDPGTAAVGGARAPGAGRGSSTGGRDVRACRAGRPGRQHRQAAAVEQGPPRHARGRVPRLGRGRGPVGPQLGQPLRRPDHRLRLRPGLRPAAADEPGQGGDVPAELAAAQGHAAAGGAGGDAARAARLGPLGGTAPRPGREDGQRHPRRGVQRDGPVQPGVPRARRSSASIRLWSRGCSRTATWRRCPGGPSRSRCCTAGSATSTWPRSTRRTRTGGGPCSRPRTRTPEPTTVTWSSTWTWPTGCGAATRPHCGRPRSGCWTRTRTGTRCCTC